MLFQALPPFVLLLTAIEACSVTMWDNDGFRGASWWRLNGPQSHANVWRHDVISSIKVEGPPGCRATFWEHPGYRGWSATLNPGAYDKHQFGRFGLRNDQISSVKLVNLCDNWGCTCQGFSDTFGTYPGNWVVGNGATERAWWSHYNCNTKPRQLCTTWGCTCQGFSNHYGTDAGVTYADAENANPGGTYFFGTGPRLANNADLKWWWSHHGCNTSPTNRCSRHHCSGQWKLKSRGAKCNGACPVNTNYCCKIDGCDKVRVASIEWKESDIYVGQPIVKHLSAYTVDGENCGVSQEKPLDSFVTSKTVSITHDESLELGSSLENTFGWSKAQESTLEWSETASMSMDIPLGDAGLGMEHSMTKTWSKTSSFAQEGGVTKGKNTNKMTGKSKQVTETIEFNGISTAVPAYAWHRHKAYYHERPIHMTLTLNVQCIIGGQVAMTKKIPGTKLITATESHLKFEPMEDLTGMCKNTHSEYGTCKCFPGLRSSFHTATGCQARMKPDGTPSDKKGCYVYKDAGCTDNIGLKDADPSKYLGDKELTRKLSLDYPLDGSMFRWSYEPCNGGAKSGNGGAKSDGSWKTVSGALGCPSSGCIKPSSSHGCKTDPKVHAGQCYWSSLTEAKARCGAWSECQAFWGPVDGKFFARGKGYTGPLTGYGAVTGYIKPEVSWKTVSGALGCPSSGCIKPSASHGCKTDPKLHGGQCHWSSLTEAKARCGAWSECLAFWGPVDGKFFARGKGYTGPLSGYGAVTGYIEQAGRRRITADSNSLPAPLNL